MDFLTKGCETPFSNSSFVEFIQQLKNHLISIHQVVQISRGKFGDKEFGEYYYRAMAEDIEKIEIVVNGLVDYTKFQAPIRKTNTVHKIIEEVLKKHQIKLEEKGVNLLRRFEKDLPETVVSDDRLRYVLNSVLQYAMVMTPPHWSIAVLTRSLSIEMGTGETKGLSRKEMKYVEISVIFPVDRKRRSGAPGTDTIHEERAPDILLRFVKEVVLRNHGMMKVGADEKKTKTFISVRFPVERRSVVYHPAAN